MSDQPSTPPRLEDLTLRIRCGHEGTYTAYGRVVDGMKPHPLGESTGYNRGGGQTYAEWCSGGSETAPTPADLLAVLTSMGAEVKKAETVSTGSMGIPRRMLPVDEVGPPEYVVIRKDALEGTE